MPEFSSAEFLDENESRAYPLKEGSTLPDSLILDMRVFSRGKRSTACQVSRIVGHGVSLGGDIEIHVDTGCLAPDGLSTDTVVVSFPAPDESQPYVQAFGWNASPYGVNNPTGDSPIGLWSSVSMTIGYTGAMEIENTDEVPDEATVEPGLVYLGGATSIHRLTIGEIDDANGAMTIGPSRNLESEISESELLLTADKGAGEQQLSVADFITLYGISLTEDEVRSPCSGVIRTINGIGPDALNQFLILDGRGLSVRSFPESNLIVITTAFAMQSKACPELPDLGDIYLWLLDDDGNLVPTDALPEELVPGQAWVLDQFGRLVPAEEFDFDPYWEEGGGGISP